MSAGGSAPECAAPLSDACIHSMELHPALVRRYGCCACRKTIRDSTAFFGVNGANGKMSAAR